MIFLCAFSSVRSDAEEDQFYDECRKGTELIYRDNPELDKCIVQYLRDTHYIDEVRANNPGSGRIVHFDPTDRIIAAANSEECYKYYKYISLESIVQKFFISLFIILVILSVISKCLKMNQNSSYTQI